MANNKKPRTKRRTLAHGITKIPICFRFGGEDERLLQLIPHQSLAKLTAGVGDESGWHAIVARLNIGLVLATDHFPDARQMVAAALGAMCDVMDRFARVEKFGASSDEARRIGAGLVMVDELQLQSSRRQLRDAVERVCREAL